MKIQFRELTSSESETVAKNHGLASYLSRLSRGQDSTPRSWWYEDRSPDWILSEVTKMIKAIEAEYPIIAEQETALLPKFGPQGGLDPFENRLDKLQEYFDYQEESPIFSSDEWKRAIKIAIDLLQLRQTKRPLAPESVVKRVAKDNKLNTNSGWPHFTRRSTQAVQEAAILAAKNGDWRLFPSILGSRSARGKQRFIFMFPMATNLVEAGYVYPLMDHIRALKLDFFSPWEGFEHVERAVTKLWKPDNWKFGSDYKGMDQHFNIHHTRQVFEVVKWLFQKDYWDSLWVSMENIHKIEILTPMGMISQDHGIASGSGWTNFVETLFQFIQWIYIQVVKLGQELQAIALGDDGEAFFDSSWERDALVKFVVDIMVALMLEANVDKQIVEKDRTHVLQRTFVSGHYSYEFKDQMGGVYPLVLATNSLVYPERFHDPNKWSGEMFAIRCLMILENTCNHPAFESYGKFVVKGNSHMREFAKLSSNKVLASLEKAKSINGFVPSYNQEKMDKPLTEFRAYKLLLKVYSSH